MCLIYREDLERALSLWDINENFKTLGQVLECIQGSGSDDPVTYGVNVDKVVNRGAEFVKVDFITEVDYAWTIDGYPAYYITVSQRFIISYVDSGTLYYAILPRISESIGDNGEKLIITFKGYDGTGAAFVRPHPDDAGSKIITSSITGATQLLLTGGNQRSFVTDGTNWHTINF